MPLPVRTVTPPPPPTPPPAPADVLVPTWFPPDGSGPLPLNPDGAVYLSLDGWSGVTGAAPVSITTDPHPRGGARVRHIQPEPRTIIWPLRFRAAQHMGLVLPWRQVAQKFTQTRRLGPGVLRIARPDGTAREISAHYEDGFSGQPGQGWLEDTAVLQLYCEDPYWRDVNPTVVARAFSDPLNYYDPYASISSGQVLGETTITNDGDVEAWPSWTVTGPMTQLAGTNHTTGEMFTLDAVLLASEVATITTDPPSVRGPAGQNWSGLLDWPTAVLWGLAPGSNDIDFAVAGAAAGTRIELAYKRRYETP